MYSGGSVTVAGFRGGHSDVGGGYEDRGLANISLEWMTSQGRGYAGNVFKTPSMPGGKFTSKMVRHQETAGYTGYADRNISGVGAHASVARLSLGSPANGRQYFRGVDLSDYNYFWNGILNPNGGGEYQLGWHWFDK